MDDIYYECVECDREYGPEGKPKRCTCGSYEFREMPDEGYYLPKQREAC